MNATASSVLLFDLEAVRLLPLGNALLDVAPEGLHGLL